MISFWKRFDKWVDSHLILLFFLLLILVLRIPNFFEPYWYGDEGIYLTLGNALRHGEKLYAEIIDHKTPLIYYLAMVKDQLQFRILLISWMLVTTTAFYSLAKKIFKTQLSLIISLIIFTLFTTLPWLEGHIPNGELFVMGFILVGWWILTKTKFWHDSLNLDGYKKNTFENNLLMVAGAFFSLGVLTKVPALMDVAAVFSLGWFSLSRAELTQKKNLSLTRIKNLLLPLMWLTLGFAIPLVLSVVYYVLRGSGQAYLDFGLLYNFRYAGEWSLPFANPILVFLFTLLGKVLLIGAITLGLTWYHQKFTPPFQLLITWSLLGLLGATLSNRPYPHYYLQIVPPVSLLIGLIIDQVNKKKIFKHLANIQTLASTATLALILSVVLLLKVEFYSTADYYQNFWKYATKQQSQMEYFNHFNPYMADNYKAADMIDEAKTNQIFIWGTNPMLYALSKTIPTGRFTVSFHIKDFNAYDETLASVKEKQPVFIIVMKDESDRFPEFFDYLNQNYIPNQNFEHFTLWKRQAT